MDEQDATSTKALADLLAVAAAHGVLAPDVDVGDLVRSGFVPRQDTADEEAEPEVFVDCAARMPVCHAVCCKLAIHMSADEVADPRLRWDPETPFLLQREADGRCTHQDRGTGYCGVYDARPKPCRRYSCAGDRRIWRDFEGMVLNQEWIDANLGGSGGLQLIQLEPLRR
jgi:putative zinc- or iron-chelating protein